MTKPWLRLYRDAILKPKVGKLTLEQLGFWSACLMLSDDDGVIPSHEDLAWQLRLDAETVGTLVSSLVRNALLIRDVTKSNENRNVFRLHDWEEHQRKSDHDQGGSERQKRWRERQKQAKSDVSQDSNALRNGGVTLSDTDTDKKKITSLRSVTRATEPKSENLPTPVVQVLPSQAPSSSRNGTAWPQDAVIPYDWIQDAIAARDKAGKGPINYGAEADRFCNHFAANGKRMKDWRRAWLNWATSPYVDQLKGTNHDTGHKQTRAGATLGSLLDQLSDDRSKVQSE